MTLATAVFDFSKILLQFVGDLLYFPIWWYTRGLIRIINWAGRYLRDRLRANGLLIWIRNIFTPMYGQTDWAGLLISFGTRVVQIIARTIAMLFWLLMVIAVVIVWLLLPIIIIYQLIFQITSFFQT